MSAVQIRLSIDKSYITIKYIGMLNFDSILTMMNSLKRHSDFNPTIHRLFDFTEATIDMEVRDTEKLIAQLGAQSVFNGDIKIAYLASDSVENAFLHLYRTFVERQLVRNIKIFSRLDHAIDWLRETREEERI